MSDSPPPVERNDGAGDASARSWAVRAFGLILVIMSVVLLTYLVVAYFGWRSGQTLSAEQGDSLRADEINHQLDLATQDIANGSPNVAARRLEWILEQDPGSLQALELQEQVLATQSAGGPAVATEPTEEAAEPEPVEEVPADLDDPLAELQALRRLAAQQEWERLLPRILAFQQTFPDYERRATDEVLFDTYLGLGLIYVDSDRVELGLNYLSQAERLGTLPQEAIDYRVWAELYLQGIAFYGVDWGIAVGYFRDLCAAAPFFQSSCSRLAESLTRYGDQYAFSQDWCPAESLYQEAWGQQQSSSLGGKLDEARQNCALATPVPVTGTLPLSDTVPFTSTEPGG